MWALVETLKPNLSQRTGACKTWLRSLVFCFSSLSGSSCLCFLNTGVTVLTGEGVGFGCGRLSHSQIFMWVLGVHLASIACRENALSPLSHVCSPKFQFYRLYVRWTFFKYCSLYIPGKIPNPPFSKFYHPHHGCSSPNFIFLPLILLPPLSLWQGLM